MPEDTTHAPELPDAAEGRSHARVQERVAEAAQVPEPPKAAGVDGSQPESLKERMHKRRAALQERRTTTLPVTGFEDLLAVEYRVLPFQQTRSIIMFHDKRQRDEARRDLYIAADTLTRACEQVFEVKPDGTRVALNMKWSAELAEYLGVAVPEGSTPRQAIFAIFDVNDNWLVEHYGEWQTWQKTQSDDVDEELMRDFARTE